MKYTAEDIKITRPPEYFGNGLDINYTLTDGWNTFHCFPEPALFGGLYDCKYIQDWDMYERTVKKGEWEITWISLDAFMHMYLTHEMAIKLLLHHLNNKAEKP